MRRGLPIVVAGLLLLGAGCGSEETAGQHELVRELDRGPVADIPSRSLKLTGRTVSWTHGAERRSATV